MENMMNNEAKCRLCGKGNLDPETDGRNVHTDCALLKNSRERYQAERAQRDNGAEGEY